MLNPSELENLCHQAIKAFPYPLKASGFVEGSFIPDNNGRILYKAGFTSVVGKYLNKQQIIAVLIEISQNKQDSELWIMSFRSDPYIGEWQTQDVLDGRRGGLLEGCYDVEKNLWHLWDD
jgi:hypothetical protein